MAMIDIAKTTILRNFASLGYIIVHYYYSLLYFLISRSNFYSDILWMTDSIIIGILNTDWFFGVVQSLYTRVV